jgi:hypothetical protein
MSTPNPAVYFTASEVLDFAGYSEVEISSLTGEEAERIAKKIIRTEPMLAEAKVCHMPASARPGSFIQRHRFQTGNKPLPFLARQTKSHWSVDL